MTIRFLTVDEVVEIQRSTLPNSGKPDISKLEGALSRIEALRDYEECEDIFKFSAMYLISIAKAHAFNDANKRTAFQAASVFLILNGVELNVSIGAGQADHTGSHRRSGTGYRGVCSQGLVRLSQRSA